MKGMQKKLNKRLIIGLGPGRCGTFSLRRFFANNGIDAIHELNFLKWKDDPGLFRNIDSLLIRPSETICGIGFFYLNYVEKILERHPDTKFVCMWRDPEEIIESWFRHTRHVNHWTHPQSECWLEGETQNDVSQYFPKYDLPKRDAIRDYVREYDKEIINLRLNLSPDVFRIFDMEKTFNTKEGMDALLDFIGIKGQRNYERVHLNLNSTSDGPDLIEHTPMPFKYGTCEFCRDKNNAEWYFHNYTRGAMTYACDNCRLNANLGIYQIPIKQEVL